MSGNVPLRAEHRVNPPYTQNFTQITNAPSGGWTWFVEPNVVEYNGTIYFTYVNGTTGDVCIRSMNSSTLAVSAETILHSALEKDDHDVPSILVRDSDKRIICFYCKHDDQTELFMRVSTNPQDISSFGTETNLKSQIGMTYAYTYPNPVQLIGETNSPIYLFFRDELTGGTGHALRYSKSTDGGTTWSAETLLYDNGGPADYWKIVDNGTDRIDFAVTKGHPYFDSPVPTGHFYYQGGSFFKTDGTAMGSPPFSFSSVSSIYVPSAPATSWVWDVARDNTGHPYVAYAQWPNSSNSNASYLYWARWNGSAWVTSQVCQGGIDLDLDPVVGHFYTGGIGFNQLDPSTVYCSREINGQYEMFKFNTPDNGTTWNGAQLTYNSSGPQMRPIGVRHYAGKIAALWMDAKTYGTYQTFSAGIRGVG